MTHDTVRDLFPEYVFGTLDARDRAAVDAHVEGCPECRALLAEETRVFDALGRGLEQTQPPPELRDRVLRAALGAPESARVTAFAPRRSRMPWLLAAAAALIALVAGWQLFAARADRERVADVLAAADLIRFDLRSDAAQARARAFWSHQHGLVFTAEGLPPVPAGRTYQLWVISRGTPISAGVFTATSNGQARIVMATPDTLTQVDAVAVTVEPAGGLAAPSTTPILVGPAAD